MQLNVITQIVSRKLYSLAVTGVNRKYSKSALKNANMINKNSVPLPFVHKIKKIKSLMQSVEC